MKTVKELILAYAKKTYKTVPDAPFRTAPTYLVLRHVICWNGTAESAWRLCRARTLQYAEQFDSRN
ncbi:MAG: hypothetical protein KIC77_02710 [Clostridiales bacterium]|jgi:hypothetical protein|nr:hypothetical protein [Clostridiales bacterium]